MRVQTRFFAFYRDLLGSTELTVDLPDGATVGDLVSSLRGRGRPFDGLPVAPAVAVNRTYRGLEAHLTDGDEVAFIPPVAGG
jgi:molybdopterin converting factor subunit 1